MLFKDLTSYLLKLENTASRNEMVEILAGLFEKTPTEEIGRVVYLLQGRVAPLYVSLEMGMADKMLLKAIARAYSVDEKEVLISYQKEGDLGKVSGNYAGNMRGKSNTVTLSEVFSTLKEIAEKKGDGTVEVKIGLISGLLSKLDPQSAAVVSRIPVGKLRLGFSDMTVLDSLSWMLSKSKKDRPALERAFNVHPDLGLIAQKIKEHGIKGVEKIKPEVGTPILMARAERLSSGEEILEKIGKCAVEAKYDGLRLQVHYKKLKTQNSKLKSDEFIKIFTRNLEEVTHMFPDIVEGVRKQVHVDEVILEGEAIAYNPGTGEFLPFQQTSERRRKYDIEAKSKEIPLKLVCFELLYMNGRSFIEEPFEKRRKELEKVIKKGETLELSDMRILDSAKDIELMFDEQVSKGLEGILAKRLDGVYQAGARGWNWIKFKRSYASSLDDTIDCVVMGYNFGQGKRTAFGLGAFLIGIYDNAQDKFVTVAKVGTGLSDVEWQELFKRCQKLKAKEKPPLYEVSKLLEPDAWIKPQIIVEIRADEITRSPAHTAGRVMKPSKSGSAFEVDVPGYALRFPRLEKFRDDKKSDDATTLKEIEKMFEAQKKHTAKKSE